MTTWNLAKVNQLKNSPVKTRLLRELKSHRNSPVNGSLAYWEQVVRSKGIDFRKQPDAYKLGKGEQGVLSTHPYTSEISPLWRFKSEEDAVVSADIIYCLFEYYLEQKEFVGADIAIKFLQMGFTRARRYANHASGKKYDQNGKIRAQDPEAFDNEKARAAQVFKLYWDEARMNLKYQDWRQHMLKELSVSKAL